MKYNFRASEEGTTAVEFALILPVLLTVIMASIEISMYLFVQSSLEGATFAVSRLGKTGYSATGMTREQTIRTALNDRLGAFFDPNKLVISSENYDNFANVDTPEPFTDTNHNGKRDAGENFTDSNGNGKYDTDMGRTGYGQNGAVVVYTVSYPWKLLTPFLTDQLGTNGTATISTRLVVKNEPYDDK